MINEHESTFLYRPITEIMYSRPAFRELPTTISIEQALAESIPGQIIVVVSEMNRPVSVLSEDRLARLPEPHGLLADYQDRFARPTITTPDTSIGVALAGMLIDRSTRWYVVAATEILGVVPAHAFSHLVARETGQSFTASSFFSYVLDLYGDPPKIASGRCFYCSIGAEYILPDAVERRPNYDPYCPMHPSHRVEEQNPCRGKI